VCDTGPYSDGARGESGPESAGGCLDRVMPVSRDLDATTPLFPEEVFVGYYILRSLLLLLGSIEVHFT